MRDGLHPRNPEIERHLIDIAARAAGEPSDGGLYDLASRRAWPGGFRRNVDWDREAREEAADWANYLLFPLQQGFAAYLRGESEASADYERRMRTLARVISGWNEQHRRAS